MAFENLGTRFQPGIEENEGVAGGRELQEAVELLNLRVPTVIGAHSPVAPQLLGGGGGLQGQPESAALMQHWRRLLGLAPMSGPMSGMMGSKSSSNPPVMRLPRAVYGKSPEVPAQPAPAPAPAPAPVPRPMRSERPYLGNEDSQRPRF